MKRTAGILIAMVFLVTCAYASDYQGDENQGSIFQKLSDLMTGKYEVKKGKTLKQVGVVQVMADQVKQIQTGPVR